VADRKHSRNTEIELGRNLDPWPMLERVEQVLREEFQQWKPDGFHLTVEVRDTGGEQTFAGVSLAKQAAAAGVHRVVSIRIDVLEDGQSRIDTAVFVAAKNLNSETKYLQPSIAVVAVGPNRPWVTGVVQVVRDEVEAMLPPPAQLPLASEGQLSFTVHANSAVPAAAPTLSVRKHTADGKLRLRRRDDPLAIYDAVSKKIASSGHWGETKTTVAVSDSGGSQDFRSVEEARRSQDGSQHKLISTRMTVAEEPVGGDYGAVRRSVYLAGYGLKGGWASEARLELSVSGPVEAEVVGLRNVLMEEMKTARRADRRRWRRVLHNPWTIAVGSSVIAGLILAGLLR
jgi:hypothetical protein